MNIDQNIFSSGVEKLLNFPTRLKDWKQDIDFLPITLEIQPTERCNHKCPSCQAQFTLTKTETRLRAKSGAEIDFNCFDSIWEHPPDGIVISGSTGDPLLYSEIVPLLKKLRELEIPTVLITNGQAMNEQIALLALETCTGIRISLDAHDENSYRNTHGVRSFFWEKTIQNIKSLVELKKDKKFVDCLIGIGYLTNNDNRNGMLSATILAKRLGVDYIQFRPFHYESGNFYKEMMLCSQIESPPDFRVFSSHQKYTNLSAFDREYKQCHGGFFYTVLDARGDFYICCHHIGNPKARLGSIYNADWQKFLESQFRRRLLENFNTGSCVPNCRLHTQNQTLEKLKNGESFTKPLLDREIKSHSVFL